MAFGFLHLPSGLRQLLLHRWPLLLYFVTWTALITATVAVAALTPEMAFVWAVSSGSSFQRPCGEGSVRLPLEGSPDEVVCVPAHLFDRSVLDAFVPPVFAVMVVLTSLCVTGAIGLWESDDDDGEQEDDEESMRRDNIAAN